jgi:hypothetical protein
MHLLLFFFQSKKKPLQYNNIAEKGKLERVMGERG